MSRTRLALAAAVIAAVALISTAAAVAGSASHNSATATTVKVTMKEFKFILSKSSVPHGKVTFMLVNKGAVAHDFKIAGKKSKLVQPRKTGTLTVTLTKGRLPYKCTVPGHAAAGMKGVLKVT